MKKILLALFLIFAALPAYAGQLAPQGPFRAFDDNGDPCTGCKLYTYEAQTTTNKTTYTTAAETVSNTNPIVLDSEGYGNVWLGDGSYKFVLKDADGATFWTLDDISGTRANAFGDEVVYISTNTTITTAYENQLIVTTASPTLSLLSAAQAGEGFTFAVKNSDSGTTTLDADGAETIDGAGTKTVEQGEGVILFSDGTNWITLLEQTVKLTQANTFTNTNTFSSSVVFNGRVKYPDDGALTIATGIITPTGTVHTVDTQAAAATDDLDTTAGIESGQMLLLRAANSSRDVVVKHNTGNFFVPQALDITLSDTQRFVGSIYDATLSKNVVLFDGTTKEYVDQEATKSRTINGTMQATTSGTSKTFAIPAGVKKIIITPIGVSTNGTSNLLVRIGVTTVSTSGYVGYAQAIGVSGSAPQTNGFNMAVGVLAAGTVDGAMILTLSDAATFLWSATWSASNTGTVDSVTTGNGHIALAGVADIISITSVTPDTFDAGNVNIQYEY